jgi:hypothetical protein
MKWRYYYYRHFIGLGLIIGLFAFSDRALAEDQFLGSLQLRGGYDSNPGLSPVGTGGALSGIDGVVVAGRSTDDYVAAFTGEGSYTRYGRAAAAPLQRYKAGFDIANKEQGGIALKAATSVVLFDSYDTRSFKASQSVRAQWVRGTVRPFVTVQAGYASLNESNPVLGDFLPNPQAFLRGTIIPGVALKKGEIETGVSVNLSVTRYRDEFDLFGFRRDNERIQPCLFLRYNKEKFSLFAALSRFYGDWHDRDFSDVRKNLYEISLSYAGEPVGFELSAKRTAEETTFPISPITIDTAYAGKLTRKLDAKTTLAVFGRYVERDYLDAPFTQRTVSYGAEITRKISEQLSAGFEIASSRSNPILGSHANGIAAVAKLTQRFGGDAAAKKRAESNASAR